MHLIHRPRRHVDTAELDRVEDNKFFDRLGHPSRYTAFGRKVWRIG